MECTTHPNVAMALYALVGMVAILLWLHIHNDRKLRKLLDHELSRLNATMSMDYKMSLSLMATVPGAVAHNRETYEESNTADMEIMNRKAPE